MSNKCSHIIRHSLTYIYTPIIQTSKALCFCFLEEGRPSFQWQYVVNLLSSSIIYFSDTCSFFYSTVFPIRCKDIYQDKPSLLQYTELPADPGCSPLPSAVMMHCVLRIQQLVIYTCTTGHENIIRASTR